jgi:hypothetical protein
MTQAKHNLYDCEKKEKISTIIPMTRTLKTYNTKILTYQPVNINPTTGERRE